MLGGEKLSDDSPARRGRSDRAGVAPCLNVRWHASKRGQQIGETLVNSELPDSSATRQISSVPSSARAVARSPFRAPAGLVFLLRAHHTPACSALDGAAPDRLGMTIFVCAGSAMRSRREVHPVERPPLLDDVRGRRTGTPVNHKCASPCTPSGAYSSLAVWDHVRLAAETHQTGIAKGNVGVGNRPEP